MKNNKNIMILIVVAIIAVVIAVMCAVAGLKGSEGKDITTDNLLFKAHEGSYGQNMAGTDYWCYDEYYLYKDKTLRIIVKYSNSGTVYDKTVQLSDKEYKAIESIVTDESIYEASTLGGCDGSYWAFALYDENGEEDEKYRDYIYGVEELENLADKLCEYNKYDNTKNMMTVLELLLELLANGF